MEVSDIFSNFATDKKQSSTVFPLVSPSIQSAGGEVPGTATIREDNSDGSGVFKHPSFCAWVFLSYRGFSLPFLLRCFATKVPPFFMPIFLSIWVLFPFILINFLQTFKVITYLFSDTYIDKNK